MSPAMQAMYAESFGGPQLRSLNAAVLDCVDRVDCTVQTEPPVLTVVLTELYHGSRLEHLEEEFKEMRVQQRWYPHVLK